MCLGQKSSRSPDPSQATKPPFFRIELRASPAHTSPLRSGPEEPQSSARADRAHACSYRLQETKRVRGLLFGPCSIPQNPAGEFSCACQQTPTLQQPLSQSTMRHHLLLIRMPSIKKSKSNNCWQGCGENEFLCTAGGDRK